MPCVVISRRFLGVKFYTGLSVTGGSSLSKVVTQARVLTQSKLRSDAASEHVASSISWMVGKTGGYVSTGFRPVFGPSKQQPEFLLADRVVSDRLPLVIQRLVHESASGRLNWRSTGCKFTTADLARCKVLHLIPTGLRFHGPNPLSSSLWTASFLTGSIE